MMKASVTGDVAELNRLLNQIPALTRESAHKKGLRPAAKVIERRVKELTPRSTTTGSTKKWSEKTKTKRSGELPLWKTTAVKSLKAGRGVLVGYKWPQGNKAHFIIEGKGKTRQVVLWGNVSAGEFRRKLDVLKRSIDETRGAASAAFVEGVRKDVAKRLEGLRRG